MWTKRLFMTNFHEHFDVCFFLKYRSTSISIFHALGNFWDRPLIRWKTPWFSIVFPRKFGSQYRILSPTGTIASIRWLIHQTSHLGGSTSRNSLFCFLAYNIDRPKIKNQTQNRVRKLIMDISLVHAEFLSTALELILDVNNWIWDSQSIRSKYAAYMKLKRTWEISKNVAMTFTKKQN